MAADLDHQVKVEGSVKYVWIPRRENQDADRCCNYELDDMENELDDMENE